MNKKLTDFVDEKYVKVRCIVTINDEIVGTDGEFYKIEAGKVLEIPEKTARILVGLGIVEIVRGK